MGISFGFDAQKDARRSMAATRTRFSIFLERKSEYAPGKAEADSQKVRPKNVDARTLGF